MSTADAPATNLHLLSRNPIFTASKNVWGYEIQSTAAVASDPAPDDQSGGVSATIIAGDYIGLNTILARNKKMLLSYTKDQLLHQIPYAFPAPTSVVLLNDACQRDATLIPALQQLAGDGHSIALQWSSEVTPTSPILAMAVIICLTEPDDARDPALRPFLEAGTTCIARNVTTKDELDRLQAEGIQLFQGHFFKTPEIIPGKKLSSHQNSRLQIMRIIETDEPDLAKLADTIQADVTLSYRLLTYLNSPAFGFARKIDSIRQAITLLGWLNVRNWLRAVLLADITQGEQQTELLHLSLHRGRFLEQIVRSYDYWNFKPDEMFLLGMFSLLDAILGISMQDALNFLPLTDAQKKALCGDSTSEYMPLLGVMNALEEADEDAQTQVMLSLSLDPQRTKQMHCEAGAWAGTILDVGGAQ